MTGSPAGRVLALLELVQEQPGRTAHRLAEALGVSERTVRRYVATLQELGIPVVPDRGRRGGYRLQPGYRMPPLMLTTDEAVGITVALALTGGADEPPESENHPPTSSRAALAKLLRALPRDVSERVADVLTAISPPSRSLMSSTPDPRLLATVASGVARSRVCRIRHRAGEDGGGVLTTREVNPYGVVVARGQTYLHAWCHLRRARRTFRLDRVENAELLDQTFVAPRDLDVRDAVETSLAMAWPEHDVSVLLEAPLAEVEPYFPRYLGVCVAVDAGTTRLRLTTRNLEATVLRLSDHPFAMTVEQPDALREAFARTAEQMRAVSCRGGSRCAGPC